MTLVKLHYHDHANTCKECGDAREEMDILKSLHGDMEQINKLYADSCQTGKDLLMAFWFSYGGGVNEGFEWDDE